MWLPAAYTAARTVDAVWYSTLSPGKSVRQLSSTGCSGIGGHDRDLAFWFAVLYMTDRLECTCDELGAGELRDHMLAGDQHVKLSGAKSQAQETCSVRLASQCSASAPAAPLGATRDAICCIACQCTSRQGCHNSLHSEGAAARRACLKASKAHATACISAKHLLDLMLACYCKHDQ